jgi:hypothetical protein
VRLSYVNYYNEVRTHRSLEKDAPVPRAVERAGHINCRPVLGGLHHQHVRILFTIGTGEIELEQRFSAPGSRLLTIGLDPVEC